MAAAIICGLNTHSKKTALKIDQGIQVGAFFLIFDINKMQACIE